MSLTIGRLARLSGLSIRSLRHYDEIGLLVPSQRSEAGYRLYSDADVERLYRIQVLRELGWTLAEVQSALADDGSSIPDILERQIDALRAQIEQATALRSRLTHVRDHLLQQRPLAPVEWLAAVELFGHYEKHLSPDDMKRLSLAVQGDKEEWRSAYAAAAAAQARGIAPDSEEAQAIAQRWTALTWRQVDGDLRLALRLRQAYRTDPGLRASMSAVGGADPAVMNFLWAAIQHKHLAAFVNHFSKDELQRMDFSDDWNLERARILGDLRDAMSHGTACDSEAVAALLAEWDCHLEEFVRGDRALKERLLRAMRSDAHLRKIWQVDEGLLDLNT